MMKKSSFWSTLLLVSLLGGCQNHEGKMNSDTIFDWQGHRGSRGLMPENTIPAFLKALEFPAIQTLELDLAVSKDGQLIISHEPWFNPNICLNPKGDSLSNNLEERVLIFQLTTLEIQTYDCGSLTPVEFPEQQPIAVFKPTLQEVIEAVRTYCEANNRALPNFNMEIKSRVDWDEIYTPPIEEFVDLVVKSLDRLNIRKETNIQSFDVRPLQIIHELDASIPLSYLVHEKKSLTQHIEDLGFTPRIISPYYQILEETFIAEAKDAGMKIIPWTVNETVDMELIKNMGVDGMITDYPNKIPK
jgi:glycerophosphoryl diester phosphodiesterase